MSREYRQADSLLAEAEKQDDRWIEPIVLRSLVAFRHARNVGLDPVESRKWVLDGLPHAERALALDPRNADALEYRGTLKYWGWLMNMEADPAKASALLASARADLEEVTRVNPSQAGAWNILSHLYYNTPGTTTVDVNLAASKALEADAFLENAERVMSRLFLSSYDLGQFASAEQACGQIRQRFPAGLLAVQCQLFMLTTRNREPDIAEAWRLADSINALTTATSQQLEGRVLAAAVIARSSQASTTPAIRDGLADSARRVVRRSEGNSEVDPTREVALPAAMVHTMLGDRSDALRLLKLYFAANPQRRASYRDDPGWWFRPLQDHPEFQQIVGGR
jgi:serine/threonine-protein kinase